MRRRTISYAFLLACLLGGAAAPGGITESPASAASPVYYCPDRKADQQYSATKGPGCVPLVERKELGIDETPSDRPVQEFKIDNLQQDVTAFLNKYREFLDCCKTDLHELRQVEALGDEVGDLLSSAQTNLTNYSLASRGIMLRELIPRVAKARADLKTLRARLETVSERTRQRDRLDFESAGREDRAINDLEESIVRDIRAPKLPGSAKTGADIGVAPAAGPTIGRTPKTGSEIGREGLTGQDIGASPKHSRDIGGSGPTGFEIGATGRAGPGIGESPLNQDASSGVNSTLQRSTVGSSISDSTVGSSIGSSTVGSSLQDTSVGSSFGGSSVGSTLQGR
jgi:hypothetical protein